MEPLMLTQLGLGAAQAIGGGITAFGQKGTSLKPLDENIAQKQENLRRKKEAENRARAQARQGFNPQDLTQMNRGATDAMGVGQANLAGLTAGQRMGASAANLGNYQQNVNKIAGANTNKMQENERYLDSTINGVNQAANQVSDAGLDKFQIEAERAAALRKAGEGFLGAGLTNLTGGAQQWQNRRDWAKLKADRDASMKGIYGGGITNGSEAMGGAGGTVTQQSLPLGAQPQPVTQPTTAQFDYNTIPAGQRDGFLKYLQTNPYADPAQAWQIYQSSLLGGDIGGYGDPRIPQTQQSTYNFGHF